MPAIVTTLPELQYCPAEKVAFVGMPGALHRGHPSITMDAHRKQVADEAEAARVAAQEAAEAQADAAKDEAGETAAIAAPVEHAAPAA